MPDWNDSINFVAGLPRSGTSLVMRMLITGGMPGYYSQLGSFETKKTLRLPRRSAWLRHCVGKCVKLLDPDLRLLPDDKGYRYRSVLMMRDPREQARSWLKFMDGMDLPWLGEKSGSMPTVDRSNRRTIQRDLSQRIKVCSSVLAESCENVLVMPFEYVINSPGPAAIELAEFSGGGLDADAMAACVVRRSPACYPGLLELDLTE